MTSHSPFLPGTHVQFAWDSTSLGWLKECPRKYQYSMIEGWRAKGDSVHLTFGIHYHKALEYYDKLRSGGTDGIEHGHEDALHHVIFSALCDTWDRETSTPWTPDHHSKTRETLIRSIIWYLDQFADDPAKTIVLANGQPAVELSFRMELDFGPGGDLKYGDHRDEKLPNYVLCGHLDRVVQFADGHYVMDRKTTSTTPGQHYFDGYSPDNQMSLYTLAARVIYQTPVSGVIIDAAQIAVGFSRFTRGFTYRTEEQLEEWLDTTKYWLRQAEGFAEDGFWPMNDKACHNYGGCVFRKVCSKSPQVRQTFLESDFEKRHWNPLEVR